ncbi:MAG TPA: choice-of-anchor tandem repeat GloVer-containing protein [Terriglobales bacterium]|nr:choice-of-anchor tandem repeat GloVer-containing protein [Terriglobales bacterium]
MKNTMQNCNWISWMRLAAATALAFAAVLVLAFITTITTQSAEAQTLTVLYTFTGAADGGQPYGGVIQDSAGNLYGTTGTGGNLADCSGVGCGTVWKLDTAGTETVLYSFAGGTADGSSPLAGVIRVGSKFYGTTQYGGAYGYGTVYELSSKGETVLHSFCVVVNQSVNCDSGASPTTGVVYSAGTLYGTTPSGGNVGYGAVYELSNGAETILHNFAWNYYGEPFDGYTPESGLTRDSAGNLYGTASGGGIYGAGILYEISASGTYTILHNFAWNSNGTPYDGLNPEAPVILDAAGDLYGTTSQGGTYGNGTVWKLSASGSYTILHNFVGGSEGALPYGSVVKAGSTIYGTTTQGGAYDAGTVWELSKTGVLTVLSSMGGSDYGGVIRDAAGNLYGATFNGGAYNFGTVWKLTP